jgi:hypothetical protein
MDPTGAQASLPAVRGHLARSLARNAVDYRVRKIHSQIVGFPAKPPRRYTLCASEV